MQLKWKYYKKNKQNGVGWGGGGGGGGGTPVEKTPDAAI